MQNLLLHVPAVMLELPQIWLKKNTNIGDFIFAPKPTGLDILIDNHLSEEEVTRIVKSLDTLSEPILDLK